jgi:transglutaminase-like putative cysteine protease
MASATRPLAGPTDIGIQKYFEVSVYLLVASGFLCLATTGSLDLAALLFASTALLLRGYGFVYRQPLLIPESWTTSLTLGYVAFYLADYFLISGGFVNATVHLVIFVMVVRLYSARKDRDYYFLAVIGFLMVLAAAILTVDSVFLLSFAFFLLVAVAAVILIEMKRSAAKANIPTKVTNQEVMKRRMLWSLARLSPAIVMGILLGGTVIFFILPRISGGYLSALAHKSDLETGFSDQVDLGGIGQIQQSGAVVMHVTIEGDDHGAYDLKWRGVALSRFNGKGWRNPPSRHVAPRLPSGDFAVDPVAEPALLRRVSTSHAAAIHYNVLMEPIGTDVFFLVPSASVLRGAYRAVALDRGGAVFNLDGGRPITRYEAWSNLPSSPPAPAEVEETVDDSYLDLPPLDSRIHTLAQEITTKSKSDYERAAAIESYLRTHFGYTLELPGTLADDPVAEFLFVRKKGHCEYFASAMAVMLRELGIPSRMVTGFRGAEFNDLTSQYVVRGSNAHAWVEAFFPQMGWVSFDPTPATAVPRATGLARVLLYVDAMKSFWRDWVVSYDSGQQRTLGEQAVYGSRKWMSSAQSWSRSHYRQLLEKARNLGRSFSGSPRPWIGGGAAFLMVLALVWHAKRLRLSWSRFSLLRSPAEAPRMAASLWYERLIVALGKRGWKKSAMQTPREFLDTIQDDTTRRKVAVFTRHYEGARFGESADDVGRLPELYEEISAARK